MNNNPYQSFKFLILFHINLNMSYLNMNFKEMFTKSDHFSKMKLSNNKANKA